jgi:DNA-binding response OmpR family regulator
MNTILVVEDDPNHEWLLKRDLTAEGYEVETTRSGREAFALATDKPFDLVVLDIHLPDADGLNLLPRLLEIHPKLHVVIYTAYVAYRDSFMSWAADAYVVKSSDTRELKQAIAAALLPDEPQS